MVGEKKQKYIVRRETNLARLDMRKIEEEWDLNVIKTENDDKTTEKRDMNERNNTDFNDGASIHDRQQNYWTARQRADLRWLRKDANMMINRQSKTSLDASRAWNVKV